MSTGESFEAFVAERDVACPACGYNLRGMRGGFCPECGRNVGFGVFGAAAPSPRMFRAGQSGALLCGLAGVTAAGVAVRAAHRNGVWAGALCAAVGLSACVVAGAWVVRRRAIARAARHEQGRWATVAWIMLAAVILVGMGTGAM